MVPGPRKRQPQYRGRRKEKLDRGGPSLQIGHKQKDQTSRGGMLELEKGAAQRKRKIENLEENVPSSAIPNRTHAKGAGRFGMNATCQE